MKWQLAVVPALLLVLWCLPLGGDSTSGITTASKRSSSDRCANFSSSSELCGYGYCPCVNDLCMRLQSIASSSNLSDTSATDTELLLLRILAPDNCNRTATKDDKVVYNECVQFLQSKLCKRGGDDLQIVVAAVAGTGGAILALLLAVIVLISVGLVCCHRRPKVTGQYSYTDGQARSSTATLSGGWPFVHPRFSRVKGKGELLKCVPEQYMELMASHKEYLMQAGRLHTNVFLSEGSYSEVYQGYIADVQPHFTSTYRNVAVKRFKEHVSKSDILHYLEASLLTSEVDHENVLRVIAVSFDSTECISIVYPYLEGHDLLSWLKMRRAPLLSPKRPKAFSITQLVKVVMEISQGMKALTAALGPYQMLSAHTCTVDAESHVMVGEVCMQQLVSRATAHGPGVQARWLAPEVLKGEQASTASDVWSFGITCWEVFTLGGHPYADLHQSSEVLTHVTGGNVPSHPPLCPQAIFALMESCWQQDALKRPSFGDITAQLSALLLSADLQEQVDSLETRLRSGDLQLHRSPSTTARRACHVRGSFSASHQMDSTMAASPAASTSLRPSTSSDPPEGPASPRATADAVFQSGTDEYYYVKSPRHVAVGSAVRRSKQDAEGDDYENADLLPCSLSTSNPAEAASLPQGDRSLYYNLPNSYLEALHPEKLANSRSSEHLQRAAASSLKEGLLHPKSKHDSWEYSDSDLSSWIQTNGGQSLIRLHSKRSSVPSRTAVAKARAETDVDKPPKPQPLPKPVHFQKAEPRTP